MISAARRLLPFVIALLGYSSAYLHMRPLATGDEPHYVLYGYSIAFDHDLDLANNYDRTTIQTYFPYFQTLDRHTHQWRGDGAEHSTHFPGLAVLIAPVLRAGGGIGAVRALMILLSALLAQQLYRLLDASGLGRPVLVWLAWSATVFSLPLVVYSGQIYPELPACLVLVTTVGWLLAERPTRRAVMWIACGAAVLPWLHVRYAVFSGGLMLCLGYRITQSDGLGAFVFRLRDRSAIRRLWPLLLPAGSLAAMLLLCHRLYGGFTPLAMYAPEMSGVAPWTLEIGDRHGLGAFFSPMVGWLPFAPVHWLALAGFLALLSKMPRAALPVVLSLAAYLALVAGPVSAGYSLPARYVIVILPLAAVPLLLVFESCPGLLRASVPLLVLSLALTVVGVRNHRLLYPDRHRGVVLPIASQLQSIWPDFGSDARSRPTEMIAGLAHDPEANPVQAEWWNRFLPSWPKTLLWLALTGVANIRIVRGLRTAAAKRQPEIAAALLPARFRGADRVVNAPMG